MCLWSGWKLSGRRPSLDVSEDQVDGKSTYSGRELQSKKLQSRPQHTANGGRTPECRATQCLQAGACYLCHRRRSDQLIPTSLGIWGNWPSPSHSRIWENPSLCSPRSPQNRNGLPARNMQEHIPCLGVSKGHTGCQGLPWGPWPSIMCFDNCRQACSFRDSAQGAFPKATA